MVPNADAVKDAYQLNNFMSTLVSMRCVSAVLCPDAFAFVAGAFLKVEETKVVAPPSVGSRLGLLKEPVFFNQPPKMGRFGTVCVRWRCAGCLPV